MPFYFLLSEVRFFWFWQKRISGNSSGCFWKKDFMNLFKKYKSRTYGAIFIFLLILIPFIVHMASGAGFSRFNQVSRKTDLRSGLSLYLKHFEPKFVLDTSSDRILNLFFWR